MFQLNIVAFFLLALSVCHAKSGGLRASDSTSKVTVQPWLIGLAAVVGFLFIVFVLLIAQRLFFKKEKNDLEVHMLEENGYYENASADFGANEETKQTSF